MKTVYLLWGLLWASVSLLAAPPHGLTIHEGKFYKDGRVFHGVGINYVTAFMQKLGLEGKPPNLNDRSHREGFEVLSSYDIPFIRFNAGGFFPREWASYLENKDAYFAAMDVLVADAEATGIGLIPSLFWYFPTVPDLVGEPVDQWGNPNSQTHAFMRQYTTEMVRRYKDSPAIWAWEFGNEYLHEANLPDPHHGLGWVVPEFGTPTERSARDKMYRKNIYRAYQAFAQTVRAIDPTRPILSGDTMPRPGAQHITLHGSWGTDSQEEWEQIFLRDNQFMDALSSHFYYFSLTDKHHDVGYMHYGPEQQMRFMQAIAQRAGKPLFVGEFGPQGKDKSRAEEDRQFQLMLDLMVSYKVPLSALWNFDFEHVDQTHWNITKDNHRSYMLQALQAANQKLQR